MSIWSEVHVQGSRPVIRPFVLIRPIGGHLAQSRYQSLGLLPSTLVSTDVSRALDQMAEYAWTRPSANTNRDTAFSMTSASDHETRPKKDPTRNPLEEPSIHFSLIE